MKGRLDVRDYIASRPKGAVTSETQFVFTVSRQSPASPTGSSKSKYTFRARNQPQFERCWGLFAVADMAGADVLPLPVQTAASVPVSNPTVAVTIAMTKSIPTPAIVVAAATAIAPVVEVKPAADPSTDDDVDSDLEETEEEKKADAEALGEPTEELGWLSVQTTKRGLMWGQNITWEMRWFTLTGNTLRFYKNKVWQ